MMPRGSIQRAINRVFADYTRCAMCDEWHDPKGPRARIHDHPEPQSGEPREQWFASRLPYSRWVVETVEGRDWLAQDPKRHAPYDEEKHR